MIGSILIWLGIIYIALVVLWRLFIAIVSIAEGYSSDGAGGALGMLALNFFVNLWDLTKFAFTIVIFGFILYLFFR